MKWACDQQTGSPGRKLVLMTLAEFADTSGVAYPSQSTIAQVSEQSVRTVREHLAQLESDGLIQRTIRYREGGTRTSDVYTLSLPAKSAGMPPEENDPTIPAKTAGDLPAKTAGKGLPAKSAGIEREPKKLTGEKQQPYRQNSPGSLTLKGKLEPSVNRKNGPTPGGASSEKCDDEFEKFWGRYPKRKGNRGKKQALTKYRARRREGHDEQQLLDAAGRYHRYCEVTGTLGGPFVMKAETFLGDPDNFDNPWTPPSKAESPNAGAISQDSEAARVKAAGPAAEAPQSTAPRQGAPPPNGSSRGPTPEQLDSARSWTKENPKDAARIFQSVEREMGELYTTMLDRNEQRAKEMAKAQFTRRLLKKGLIS